MHKITIENRGSDWLAYLNGNKAKWEAGRTQSEAIHKLLVTYQLELRVEIEVKV